MSEGDSVLGRLTDVIEDRRKNPPPRSYTSRLFDGGVTAIGAKITEEAAEVVAAAGEEGDAGRRHLVRETADLLYHMMVLLSFRETRLSDVELELARRFGVSGIDEKESRSP